MSEWNMYDHVRYMSEGKNIITDKKNCTKRWPYKV